MVVGWFWLLVDGLAGFGWLWFVLTGYIFYN